MRNMPSIKEIIKMPEGKTLEFKRDMSSQEKIVKTIIAFANSAGGKLIIGINDDRSIFGFDNSFIQCARFAGKTKAEFIDHIEIYEKPAEAINQIEIFLKKHALRGFALKGMKRVDITAENVPENRLNVIINLIRDYAEISMLDLSKKLNVNHKTIKREIQILKSKGLIERVGADKGGYWRVHE